MLSYCTVDPHTLELLKELTSHPLNTEMRLVGGTALALQYGHRKSVDLDFFGTFKGDAFDFRDMIRAFGKTVCIKETDRICIYHFDDAEQQPMPVMFNDIAWTEIKKTFMQK